MHGGKSWSKTALPLFILLWTGLNPPIPQIHMLKPNVMLFGGGEFGRSLGHECGALKMGLVPLQGEMPESLLSLSCEGTVRKQLPASKEESSHQNPAILVP